MLQTENTLDKEAYYDTPIMESPGGEDDNEEGDWTDIDDEDFEDMAEDRDDFQQMELENDIYDPDDDDHLPDDDLE